MATRAPDLGPSRLQGLFPPGIVTVERLAEGEIDALSGGEAACLGRAGPKRAREFAAGRQCARAALLQLGVVGWDLAVRPDRTPAWPDGIVGSISHTTGFCAAAVGHSRDCRSIGLDVEIDRRVTAELHSQFLTSAEQVRLNGRPPEMADRLATLIFSAKEAFYKAQYPMTAEWLEFADLEIRLLSDLSDAGEIEVRPTRRLQLESSIPQPWRGRYGHFDRVVATGVVLQVVGRR
jgi:4'-phosphopantetheinyl transferase EntD